MPDAIRAAQPIASTTEDKLSTNTCSAGPVRVVVGPALNTVM